MSAEKTLLLVVGVIRPLSLDMIQAGARAAGWSPEHHHPHILVDLSDAWHAAGASNDTDHVGLQQDVRTAVSRQLTDHPCHVIPTVIVAALAPMTILLEIGWLLRIRGYRLIVLDQHRESDSWQWPSTASQVTASTEWAVALPSVASTAKDPIAILVSISGRIVLAEVASALGALPQQHAHIAVAAPQRGLVQSQHSASVVVESITKTLTRIRDTYPDHSAIYFFLAVPTSVALLLGHTMQDGFGRNMCVYENASQGVTRHYVPGGHFFAKSSSTIRAGPTSPLELQSMQQEFDSAIARLQTVLPATSMAGWPQALIPHECAPQAAALALSQRSFQWFTNLDPSIMHHLTASITTDISEFRFDPRSATLRISPALTSAIARGFAANQMDALPNAAHDQMSGRGLFLQLFLLHEWAHEVQNLDGAHATDVGRFPKALEELDWVADTFALVTSLGSHRGISLCEAAMRTTQVMLTGMVAFQPDPMSAAASYMEARRLNRHLIWLVQYHRLAALQPRAADPQQIWNILASKPIVDMKGLPPLVRNERMVVDLDRGSRTPDLALGLVLNGRLRRLGHERSLDLQGCLHHLRHQRAPEAIAALAGLHGHLRSM